MTDFSPGLVEEVARALARRRGSTVVCIDDAKAALEASHHAELVEALKKAALDLHETAGRFCEIGNLDAMGCSQAAREAARRADALLAKIGGEA